MRTADAGLLAELDRRLAGHGLMTRGAVAEGAGTIVLVGYAGSSIWPHFEKWRAEGHGEGTDPLDRWSKQVIGGVAEEFDVEALFPSDRPYRPFQQWAMAAEGLKASPLGLLIHPVYGLWHAYRGALFFAAQLALPRAAPVDHPCDTCRDKPCLTRCPVSAFSDDGYDVDACRRHLGSQDGASCLIGGCLARNACPVGQPYRYSADQRRFHMAAFSRA